MTNIKQEVGERGRGCRGWCGCWGAVVATATSSALCSRSRCHRCHCSSSFGCRPCSFGMWWCCCRRCWSPRWCCTYTCPLRSVRPPFSLCSFVLALVFTCLHLILPLVALVPARSCARLCACLSTATAGSDGVAAGAAAGGAATLVLLLSLPLPLWCSRSRCHCSHCSSRCGYVCSRSLVPRFICTHPVLTFCPVCGNITVKA